MSIGESGIKASGIDVGELVLFDSPIVNVHPLNNTTFMEDMKLYANTIIPTSSTGDVIVIDSSGNGNTYTDNGCMKLYSVDDVENKLVHEWYRVNDGISFNHNVLNISNTDYYKVETRNTDNGLYSIVKYDDASVTENGFKEIKRRVELTKIVITDDPFRIGNNVDTFSSETFSADYVKRYHRLYDANKKYTCNANYLCNGKIDYSLALSLNANGSIGNYYKCDNTYNRHRLLLDKDNMNVRIHHNNSMNEFVVNKNADINDLNKFSFNTNAENDEPLLNMQTYTVGSSSITSAHKRIVGIRYMDNIIKASYDGAEFYDAIPVNIDKNHNVLAFDFHEMNTDELNTNEANDVFSFSVIDFSTSDILNDDPDIAFNNGYVYNEDTGRFENVINDMKLVYKEINKTYTFGNYALEIRESENDNGNFYLVNAIRNINNTQYTFENVAKVNKDMGTLIETTDSEENTSYQRGYGKIVKYDIENRNEEYVFDDNAYAIMFPSSAMSSIDNVLTYSVDTSFYDSVQRNYNNELEFKYNISSRYNQVYDFNLTPNGITFTGISQNMIPSRIIVEKEDVSVKRYENVTHNWNWSNNRNHVRITGNSSEDGNDKRISVMFSKESVNAGNEVYKVESIASGITTISQETRFERTVYEMLDNGGTNDIYLPSQSEYTACDEFVFEKDSDNITKVNYDDKGYDVNGGIVNSVVVDSVRGVSNVKVNNGEPIIAETKLEDDILNNVSIIGGADAALVQAGIGKHVSAYSYVCDVEPSNEGLGSKCENYYLWTRSDEINDVVLTASDGMYFANVDERDSDITFNSDGVYHVGIAENWTNELMLNKNGSFYIEIGKNDLGVGEAELVVNNASGYTVTINDEPVTSNTIIETGLVYKITVDGYDIDADVPVLRCNSGEELISSYCVFDYGNANANVEVSFDSASNDGDSTKVVLYNNSTTHDSGNPRTIIINGDTVSINVDKEAVLLRSGHVYAIKISEYQESGSEDTVSPRIYNMNTNAWCIVTYSKTTLITPSKNGFGNELSNVYIWKDSSDSANSYNISIPSDSTNNTLLTHTTRETENMITLDGVLTEDGKQHYIRSVVVDESDGSTDSTIKPVLKIIENPDFSDLEFNSNGILVKFKIANEGWYDANNVRVKVNCNMLYIKLLTSTVRIERDDENYNMFKVSFSSIMTNSGTVDFNITNLDRMNMFKTEGIDGVNFENIAPSVYAITDNAAGMIVLNTANYDSSAYLVSTGSGSDDEFIWKPILINDTSERKVKTRVGYDDILLNQTISSNTKYYYSLDDEWSDSNVVNSFNMYCVIYDFNELNAVSANKDNYYAYVNGHGGNINRIYYGSGTMVINDIENDDIGNKILINKFADINDDNKYYNLVPLNSFDAINIRGMVDENNASYVIFEEVKKSVNASDDIVLETDSNVVKHVILNTVNGNPTKTLCIDDDGDDSTAEKQTLIMTIESKNNGSLHAKLGTGDDYIITIDNKGRIIINGVKYELYSIYNSFNRYNILVTANDDDNDNGTSDDENVFVNECYYIDIGNNLQSLYQIVYDIDANLPYEYRYDLEFGDRLYDVLLGMNFMNSNYYGSGKEKTFGNGILVNAVTHGMWKRRFDTNDSNENILPITAIVQNAHEWSDGKYIYLSDALVLDSHYNICKYACILDRNRLSEEMGDIVYAINNDSNNSYLLMCARDGSDVYEYALVDDYNDDDITNMIKPVVITQTPKNNFDAYDAANNILYRDTINPIPDIRPDRGAQWYRVSETEADNSIKEINVEIIYNAMRYVINENGVIEITENISGSDYSITFSDGTIITYKIGENRVTQLDYNKIKRTLNVSTNFPQYRSATITQTDGNKETFTVGVKGVTFIDAHDETDVAGAGITVFYNIMSSDEDMFRYSIDGSDRLTRCVYGKAFNNVISEYNKHYTSCVENDITVFRNAEETDETYMSRINGVNYMYYRINNVNYNVWNGDSAVCYSRNVLSKRYYTLEDSYDKPYLIKEISNSNNDGIKSSNRFAVYDESGVCLFDNVIEKRILHVKPVFTVKGLHIKPNYGICYITIDSMNVNGYIVPNVMYKIVDCDVIRSSKICAMNDKVSTSNAINGYRITPGGLYVSFDSMVNGTIENIEMSLYTYGDPLFNIYYRGD